MSFPHDTETLAGAGDVAPSTILKWKQKGFFEDCPPHRTGDGRTTGAGYRWTEDAMRRVQFIKAQREQGFSMEQILETLHAQGVPPLATKRRRSGKR